jgi:hypothetical protein
MQKIQAFQVAARQCGFIEMDECGEGTVVWLRKATADAATGTHQRMCIDSLTDSASVYFTNVRGKLDSKTFRSVTALQEWLSAITLVEKSDQVAPECSAPDGLPSVAALSIAVGAGKSSS